jgi:ABC-type hemin transport system substrate-binding protein
MKSVNKKKAAELEKSIETRVEAIKKEFENKERVVFISKHIGNEWDVLLSQCFLKVHTV